MSLLADLLLSAEEWTALRLSFQVAATAAVAGLPAAVAIGYLLARRRFLGKWLVELAVNLPLVMPPVVVGYLLLAAFAPAAPSGRCWPIGSASNWSSPGSPPHWPPWS